MGAAGDADAVVISCHGKGSTTVHRSILDAIKEGLWDYEPEEIDDSQFDSTRAMPGTDEKLEILADRVERGLPLWHSSDRTDYDE